MQTSAYIFHFCSLARMSRAALLLQFTRSSLVPQQH